MDSTRAVFCLYLGMLSTFCAEFFSGSFPAAFFTPYGILFVVPLYSLHILVLSSYIWHRGRITLPVLYFAGCIFGLYEAFITKVLFSPPWGALLGTPGGIAVFELFTVSFFWHPVFAFILPLWIAGYATESREVENVLPAFLRRPEVRAALVVHLALFAGAANHKTSMVSLISFAGSLGALSLLHWYLGRVPVRPMKDLLPEWRSGRLLLVPLGMYYVLSYFTTRTEVLPGPTPQLLVLVVYLMVFGAMWKAIAAGRPCAEKGRYVHASRALPYILLFSGVFLPVVLLPVGPWVTIIFGVCTAGFFFGSLYLMQLSLRCVLPSRRD